MFTCPISLEEFTCPIVLPCGHTFDRQSILKLKGRACPLCKRPFFKDQYAPNWILIEHLGLDIKLQSQTHEWNAQDAKHEMCKIEIDERIVIHLLKKIKRHAILGHSDLTYTYYSWTMTQRMINSLQHRLEQRGFHVSTWPGCLWGYTVFVSWLHVNN